MCPSDAQNMSNLAFCVQKASKLQGNVHNVSNLWTLYGHIEFSLVTFWTFVIWGTKYVQTEKKCPKYVHNVSKLWTLFWTRRRHISSNRKVSILIHLVTALNSWSHLPTHSKGTEIGQLCQRLSGVSKYTLAMNNPVF